MLCSEIVVNVYHPLAFLDRPCLCTWVLLCSWARRTTSLFWATNWWRSTQSRSGKGFKQRYKWGSKMHQTIRTFGLPARMIQMITECICTPPMAVSQALSWYAVAMYYMCTRQYDQARRYFGKATSMDPGLSLAWIGYGHAFAAQDERDQVDCGAYPGQGFRCLVKSRPGCAECSRKLYPPKSLTSIFIRPWLPIVLLPGFSQACISHSCRWEWNTRK